ncbi:MAG: glycosyltransferase [Gemmatimonadaceae bacterium]
MTHVIHCLEGGGMELILAAMVRGFRDTQVRTSIITLDGRVGSVGGSLRDDVEQIIAHRSSPGWSMLLPLSLAEEIRRTCPDVVHLYSGAWYKGALAARLAGVRRVVYTEHGLRTDDHPLAPVLFRLAARLTTDITAVSGKLCEHLVRSAGVARSRVRTIENGVDVDAFTPGPPPSDVRLRLGIPEDAAIIGTVGRLEAVKAYDVLIRAVASLGETESSRAPYLVLCGAGSLRDSLESLARELGVEHRVRFAGWAERPVEYYRLFDVFALSSLSEGAPMSLMEAMATGTAPVVTDVGAVAQILGPELRDQLVPSADVAALANALGRTISSRRTIADIGSVARDRIVDRYSFRRMIADYEALYRQ